MFINSFKHMCTVHKLPKVKVHAFVWPPREQNKDMCPYLSEFMHGAARGGGARGRGVLAMDARRGESGARSGRGAGEEAGEDGMDVSCDET